MASRPLPLIAAVLLLLVIGLSGLSAGVGLIGTIAGAADVPWVGVAIGGSIAVYGALATAAGIGLFRGGQGWWWLAAMTIGAGLVFQVGLVVVLGGLDAIFASGILVWSVTLAVLLAPATRASIRR